MANQHEIKGEIKGVVESAAFVIACQQATAAKEAEIRAQQALSDAREALSKAQVDGTITGEMGAQCDKLYLEYTQAQVDRIALARAALAILDPDNPALLITFSSGVGGSSSSSSGRGILADLAATAASAAAAPQT